MEWGATCTSLSLLISLLPPSFYLYSLPSLSPSLPPPSSLSLSPSFPSPFPLTPSPPHQVIEDNFTHTTRETLTIHNTAIICMLLRWLPSLPPSLRKWLVQNLFDLSTMAVHNRQQCCVAGVLRVIVEVLSKSQSQKKYVGKQVESGCGLSLAFPSLLSFSSPSLFLSLSSLLILLVHIHSMYCN